MRRLRALPPRGDPRLAAACLLLLGIIGAGLCLRVADSDEVHHAHAAWLSAHGWRPYRDFGITNTPALWQALRLYYLARPADGPEVLYWGRWLCLASLLLCLWLTRRIWEARGDPDLAPLHAALWLPFAFASRTATLRPEVLALPLLAGAVLSEAQRRGRGEGRPWLTGLLAGLSVYCSPRGVTLLFALGAFSLRPASRRGPLLFAAGTGAALALALLSVDPGDAWRWVVRANGGLGPVHSALPLFAHWLDRLPHAAILALAAVLAARRLLAREDGWAARCSILYLAALLPPFLERRPFEQSFILPFWLAAGLVAEHLGALWRRGAAWRRVAALESLLLVGLPLARSPLFEFRTDAQGTLSRQVSARRALCRLLGGRPVLIGPALHPIGAPDASFYWGSVAQGRSLEELGIGAPPLDLLRDIETRAPAVIDRTLLDPELWGCDARRLEAALAKDYYEPPGTRIFLYRKGFP